MRLVLIPPYKGMQFVPGKGQYMLHELVDNMRARGQLEGVEIDIDDGYDYPPGVDPVARDEEFGAHISTGIVRKVKEYSESGKYDAIVLTGDLEAGFCGARVASRIPVASIDHSAAHVASLIGDRVSIFAVTDPCGQIVRRAMEVYGLSHKVISVRNPNFSSTHFAKFAKEYKKEERAKVPGVQEIVKALTKQCITAINDDRVDSIVFGCTVIQIYADEVRAELDKAGYEEVPIICALTAGVEMAKAMVNLKIRQAARAYPTDNLKSVPEYR